MGQAAISVIGQGRIGGALVGALHRAGCNPRWLGRTSEFDFPAEFAPVVVATRTGDVPGVVESFPAASREDVVLIQNGDLLQLRQEWGLPSATLGVLWMAVATRGDVPVPGRTSVLWGRHAAELARLFTQGGLPFVAVDEGTIRRELALKLLWLSIVPLLAARRHSAVGLVAHCDRDLLRALVRELAPICAQHYGIELTAAEADDVLLDYTRAVGQFPGGVKEVGFRNRRFLEWGDLQGQPQPVHRALMQEVGAAL